VNVQEWQAMKLLRIGIFSLLLPLLLMALTLGSATRADAIALLKNPPPTPAPIAAPVRLQIPSIGLDALIEAVGQTASGQMGVPEDVDNVAWYEPGTTPGQQGNAVISGHLDDPKGPTVFWNLRKLKVNDQVIVVDAAGIKHTFAVIGKESYSDDSAPLDQIFGFDLERDLNLITCDGVWNNKAHQYTQRLVVYTRLVTSQ
jgi:sortase A